MTSEAGYLVAAKGKVPTFHCVTIKEARTKAKSIAPSVIIEVSPSFWPGAYVAEVVATYDEPKG